MSSTTDIATCGKRPFALIDRDGTINVERHYLSHPDQLELLPGAAAGLRALQSHGWGLVVVTNQSGIGRGYFTPQRLDEIHCRLRSLLDAEGVSLNGIYFCPHVASDGCLCRKPLPGLARQAATDFGFDLANSFTIGDKACDIDMGRAAGTRTILVRTGYGASLDMAQVRADMVADNLAVAAKTLLLTSGLRTGRLSA